MKVSDVGSIGEVSANVAFCKDLPIVADCSHLIHDIQVSLVTFGVSCAVISHSVALVNVDRAIRDSDEMRIAVDSEVLDLAGFRCNLVAVD